MAVFRVRVNVGSWLVRQCWRPLVNEIKLVACHCGLS